jgi:hypothetical protein
MKFNVGDTVRFLNETGGGKITRLENKGYIYVMTDDGFEIPVSANELIMQTPAFSNPEIKDFVGDEIARTDKTRYRPPATVERKVDMDTVLPENVHSDAKIILALGFVPENIDAVFKTTINSYLINDSDYFLFYKVGYQEHGKYLYLKSGEIEPNTKCFLSDFSVSRLSRINLVHIQALAVCTGQYFKSRPIDEEINVTHYDFTKNHHYNVNEYFDEKALILDIIPAGKRHDKNTTDNQVNDLLNGNTGMIKENHSKTQIVDNMEVDLHIEALREDYSHLTNGEILRIQMHRFRSALEEGISNKAKRIVFIHGVGNGILKLELRNELKRSYPEYTYQDASFKEYGFGATLVHLR